MYEVKKGKEPNSLTSYKRLPGAIYDGPNFTSVKADIRSKLLNEQGYTCAYCMQRISIGEMKVEHWAPQDRHPNLQLTYQNLLGCCKGNEGHRINAQTCDTRKANSTLRYSPANANDRINGRIKYSGDGTIKSSEADFDLDLNRVLNLNYTRLKSNRNAAINTIQKLLNNKQGVRNKDSIKKLIIKVNGRNSENMLQPFYGVMITYLTSKL